MKYLKKFEGRNRYSKMLSRDVTYKYLSAEDKAEVKNLVIEFMKDKKIIDSINELEFSDFRENRFDYLEVWIQLFCSRAYVNVYQFIDSFHFKGTTPEIRNSLQDVMEELYNENNTKEKLDQQLINILEQDPARYKKIYKSYGEEFNKVVKKACEWMLSPESYNL